MTGGNGALRILAIDTETTGLSGNDRIVSFAGIQIDFDRTGASMGMTHKVKLLHRLFDPGRKSHFRAQEIHGYSDWLLRHQDTFSDHATDIKQLIETSDLIIAHNLAFDQRFIEHEFAIAGVPIAWPASTCTMEELRSQGRQASLAAGAAAIGYHREGERHGALEDAFLALMIFLNLQDHGAVRLPIEAFRGPATAYPAPPKTGRAPNRDGYRTAAATWKIIGPTVTLLAAIAWADGAPGAIEMAILEEAAAAEMASVSTVLTGFRAGSFVGTFAEAAPSQDDIAFAAQWFEDEARRQRLAAAAYRIIRADGEINPAEIATLRRVTQLVGQAGGGAF